MEVLIGSVARRGATRSYAEVGQTGDFDEVALNLLRRRGYAVKETKNTHQRARKHDGGYW